MSFGRLGDIYGRMRIYNLGFVIFTVAAVALVFDPSRAPYRLPVNIGHIGTTPPAVSPAWPR